MASYIRPIRGPWSFLRVILDRTMVAGQVIASLWLDCAPKCFVPFRPLFESISPIVAVAVVFLRADSR
jgi:hypothetical protein